MQYIRNFLGGKKQLSYFIGNKRTLRKMEGNDKLS